jgi:hypothetical protein
MFSSSFYLTALHDSRPHSLLPCLCWYTAFSVCFLSFSLTSSVFPGHHQGPLYILLYTCYLGGFL